MTLLIEKMSSKGRIFSMTNCANLPSVLHAYLNKENVKHFKILKILKPHQVKGG